MGTPVLECTGGGAQPHRVMGGLLQLDFDLGAEGVRWAAAWGKVGVMRTPRGPPAPRRPPRPGGAGLPGGVPGGSSGQGVSVKASRWLPEGERFS